MKFSFVFSSFLLLYFFVCLTPILAFNSYEQGSIGYDISYPQCDTNGPNPPYDFAVIGVTHGKAFTRNSCLANEYAVLKKHTSTITLYMNINFPSGISAAWAMQGPKGLCSSGDASCRAYNYGYNAAADAYNYAASQFIASPMWWLDVEIANYWADDIRLNPVVIDGAQYFFQSHNVQAGIYSTKHDWTTIMGSSYTPRDTKFHPLPDWIGTGGTNVPLESCFNPFSPESPVWLVQYDIDSIDMNYGCNEG